MDHLHTLNDLTPKIKSNGRNGIEPSLIFGLDSKLFSDSSEAFAADASHNDEVQTVTILRGALLANAHSCDDCDTGTHSHVHHGAAQGTDSQPALTKGLLTSMLATLPKESVWRVKGFVRLLSPPSTVIVNWAFGRVEITPFTDGAAELDAEIRLTVMGERGEVRSRATKFASALGAVVL